MSRICIFLISLYRRFISPLKRVPSCRFQPTCSAYAIEALSGVWAFLYTECSAAIPSAKAEPIPYPNAAEKG